MFDQQQQKIYQAAIWLIPGIGDILTKQLIAYCGSVEGVFKANLKKLIQVPGIGEKTAREILSRNSFAAAEKLLQACEKARVTLVHYADPEYPSRFRHILDSPALLFINGNADLENGKTVAIVGTRKATLYGKRIVEEIIAGLSAHKALIVSGLAYGIDIHAHKTALQHNMSTVGVIAGGINRLYPSSHADTARKMLERGGIIAEYPPDTMPEAHHFPERNRIIAGLADLTIVVETGSPGGAMITAEYANNYNREVFAVPGNIHVVNSEGCNKLIRNHKAHIYTSFHDIEYIMNWDILKPKPKNQDAAFEGLSDSEKNIMQVFRNNNNELLIDELSWKSNIPLNQLAGHLLNLELRGLVKSLPGKKFRLSV
ncbi:MAG TPA: DNA-processing protein DprA [Cyclobacteriaceae bacterium]|nr:DNA-processing protein DprA [Cyclobacteriaceae bacterium]